MLMYTKKEAKKLVGHCKKLLGRFQALDVQSAASRPLLYTTDAAEESMSRAPQLR